MFLIAFCSRVLDPAQATFLISSSLLAWGNAARWRPICPYSSLCCWCSFIQWHFCSLSVKAWKRQNVRHVTQTSVQILREQFKQANEWRGISEGAFLLLIIFFSFPKYASCCFLLVLDLFQLMQSSLSIIHKDRAALCVYGDNKSLHFHSLFNLKTLSTLSTGAGGFPIFPTFYLFLLTLPSLSFLPSILSFLEEIRTREVNVHFSQVLDNFFAFTPKSTGRWKPLFPWRPEEIPGVSQVDSGWMQVQGLQSCWTVSHNLSG